MSHTPTPWTWEKWGDEPVPCIIGPEGDERICEMNGNEDGQANAELIVQAVNSHQAMKAALEDVFQFLKRSGYDTRIVKHALDMANGKDKEP